MDRGEVSRGTTLIVLAHISALLYREAPAVLSRGRSKLAADRLAEGLSPSPSLLKLPGTLGFSTRFFQYRSYFTTFPAIVNMKIHP